MLLILRKLEGISFNFERSGFSGDYNFTYLVARSERTISLTIYIEMGRASTCKRDV